MIVLTNSGKVAVKDAKYYYTRKATQSDHGQNEHAECEGCDYHQHGNASIACDKTRRNASHQVGGIQYHQLEFTGSVSTTIPNIRKDSQSRKKMPRNFHV